MQDSFVIGVDIGTGSVKAIAVDFACTVVGKAQVYYPPAATAHEQNATEVFAAFMSCVEQLCSELQTAPRAVCLSAAMHSVMAVDEDGEPLMPASLWSDTRSRDVAESLRNTEQGHRLYAATGTPVHSMSPLCKLVWLKTNQLEIFSAAEKFISLKEYIWFRLFGEYKVDHSLASATGLFNVHSLNWEEEAMAFASVSSTQLSEPVPTSYANRKLDPQAAAAMALPVDTPFFIGASDGCLANLGGLCLDETVAAVTIGTSAAVRLTTTQAVTDTDHSIFTYRLNEERFVCGGATNNGGNVLQWLVERFVSDGEAASYASLFASIDKTAAGAEGLLFLPYLHGERAPVWDEKTCGVFFGARAVHTQAHFARAVVEGLCFGLKEILTVLECRAGAVRQIKLSGAGAAHPLMQQLLADVMGKEVLVQTGGDASAIGAAYMALKGLGVISDYSQIRAGSPVVLQPRKSEATIYEKSFALYRQMYPALKDFMHLHHLLNEG